MKPSPDPQHRRPPPLAFAGAMALVTAYLSTTPLAGRKDGDFVHLWIAGRLALRRAGARLYDEAAQLAVLREAVPTGALPAWGPQEETLGAVLYPPPAALLLAPFGALPLHRAATVMALVAVGLGVASAWLLYRTLRPPHRGPWGLVALLLLFPPFFYTFVLGQTAALSLLLVVGAWYAMDRKRDLGAGLLLGALVFKPTWWLMLLWVPLVLRRWRVLAGMALGTAALVAAASAWIGLDALSAWRELAPRIAALPAAEGYRLHLQYNGVALFRRYLPSLGATVLGWSSALLLLGATAWKGIRLPRGALPPAWMGAAVLAAAWTNPHLHHYDVLLVFTAVAAAVAALPDLPRRQRRVAVAVLVFHHLAFVAVDALHLDASLPLPTLAMLALWLTLWRMPVSGGAPVRSPRPPRPRGRRPPVDLAG